MQLKYSRLWKIYFSILCLFYFLWLISIPLSPDNLEFFSLIRTLIGMIGVVGLYSFAWRFEIGTPTIWKILLGFEAMMMVYGTVSIVLNIYTEPELTSQFFLTFLFVMMLLYSPYLYALYQLSFNSKQVWLKL